MRVAVPTSSDIPRDRQCARREDWIYELFSHGASALHLFERPEMRFHLTGSCTWFIQILRIRLFCEL